jgi:tRNA (cytidine/uridine-2'-O-)-methyltransferase
MRLALYEPDIPQNAGAMMRLAACLGVAVDLIEPCGFLVGDRAFRRAGMDYLDAVDLRRHASWRAFLDAARAEGRRLVLLTTAGETSHTAFRFSPRDTLVVGRESAGAPVHVHRAAHARVRIPLMPGLRSLNVATAAAIALGEALRQLDAYPREARSEAPLSADLALDADAPR